MGRVRVGGFWFPLIIAGRSAGLGAAVIPRASGGDGERKTMATREDPMAIR